MKNPIGLLGTITLVMVIGASLTGCKNNSTTSTTQRKLESIAVTTPPTKIIYIIGDEFDPAGMVVTATYDDGSTDPVVDYMLSGLDSDTAGTKTITVSYADKETTLDVTVQQAESFAITFTQIADAAPDIVGPTIYLLEREGKPPTATITVESPEQYDLDSIKWYVNGSSSATSNASITLDSSDYTLIGEYSLTVEVEKAGIPYNKTITFTVAP